MIVAARFAQSFFARPADVVAKELLGARLHRVLNGVELVGRIVETEAYDEAEAACHGHRGRTQRNGPIFDEAGFSYVYFTYGMHYCFNVVADNPGRGAAVLIRALEPIEGLKEMYAHRPAATHDADLCSGPAKLCQALNIGRSENMVDLIAGETLYLSKGKLRTGETVRTTSRIGITQARELPWRFFIAESPFVSKGKPS